MRSVLRALADVPGVRGSMVVTLDGIVVDSLIGRTLRQEVVGAMAATLIQGTRRAAEGAGLVFESFSVVSTHGKMIVADTGAGAFLVVVLDRAIDLGSAELEIRSAVRKVKSLGGAG